MVELILRPAAYLGWYSAAVCVDQPRADGTAEQIELYIADMTAEERAIVKAGCLINYNKFKAAAE